MIDFWSLLHEDEDVEGLQPESLLAPSSDVKLNTEPLAPIYDVPMPANKANATHGGNSGGYEHELAGIHTAAPSKCTGCDKKKFVDRERNRLKQATYRRRLKVRKPSSEVFASTA